MIIKQDTATILHDIYTPMLISLTLKTSPASRQSQHISNQSPTSRQQSPTGRPLVTDFYGQFSPTNCQPVPNWSAIDRRLIAVWSTTKTWRFWSHGGCIDCSWFLVVKQSPTGCSSCVTVVLHSTMVAIQHIKRVESSEIFRLRFHWILFFRFEWTIFQHWFR